MTGLAERDDGFVVLPATEELVVRGHTVTVAAAAATTTDERPAPAEAPSRLGASRWTRRCAALLVATDTVAAIAAITAARLRFLNPDPSLLWMLLGAAVVLGWLLALQRVGAYDTRRLSGGTRDLQRVVRATLFLAGGVAIVAYLLDTDAERPVLALSIPLGAVLMVLGRFAVRQYVHRQRARGEWTSTILAVGTRETVHHLVDVTNRASFAGLKVIGACVEDAEIGSEIAPGVPVLGDTAQAAALAEAHGTDIVAVAGAGMGPRRIRELGWALEGTGRQMVMAPGLTDVAGPRLHISPVENLPLMWVDQPQFTGMARVAKRAVDIAGSAFLLLIGSPFLLLTALAVRLTTAGPAFYRSTRMGAHGREITVWKFRSMYVGADRQKAALAAVNEGAGALFKMRRDPRVTPIGRVLRKFSIDEVPQLFNVLGGSMSLVGPRPPLREEVEQYDAHVHRRLLVKPGMTGLWQVSGRSDLPWDEAVRLDLYYVENWSFGLDLAIILRTVWAVLRGRGAY